MFNRLEKWVGKQLRPEWRSARSPPRRPSFRPLCEVLEDRRLLSQTITVTSNADSGSNSLRAAIAQNQTDGGGDTIQFSVTSPITLASQLIIADNITITGPGAGLLTISGGGTSRIFDITAVTVNISDVTLSGGSNTTSGGGAISNSGVLTLANSIVTGNTDTAAGGGGIINYDKLYLNYCTVSNNTTTTQGGAGILNRTSGVLSVLHVDHSTISGNVSSAGGKGGGGIYNAGGNAFVSYSNISNNSTTAGFGGAGIFMRHGNLSVTDSTISGNRANSGGFGGGLFQSYGTTTLSNSTISGNYAMGNGAAIYVNNMGSVTITSCTIAANTAAHASGIFSSSGGGAATVTLLNTIVAGNTGSGGESDLNGSGTFTSSGYNAFGSKGSVTITTLASDIVSLLAGSDLGPLQNNGGAVTGPPGSTMPLETMALLPGNPAVNAGDPALATTLDERGMPRNAGTGVDIGAYQHQVGATTKLVVSGATPQTAGVAFNITVTAEDAFGDTTPGYTGTVSFTTSATSATLPGNSPLSSGVGTFSVTLNSAGAQTITAADTVTSSIKGTSNSITVSPAAGAAYRITGGATLTAGGTETITVTLVDQYQNVYTGIGFAAASLTFSGLATAPDGTHVPTVNGTALGTAVLLTFTSGVATATLQAFDAQTATLDVSGVGGTSSQSAGGTGLTLTVSATLASAYQLTGGTTLTAAGTETVTITQFDAFLNQTALTGSVSLTFSGLNPAANGTPATVDGTALGRR